MATETSFNKRNISVAPEVDGRPIGNGLYVATDDQKMPALSREYVIRGDLSALVIVVAIEVWSDCLMWLRRLLQSGCGFKLGGRYGRRLKQIPEMRPII